MLWKHAPVKSKTLLISTERKYQTNVLLNKILANKSGKLPMVTGILYFPKMQLLFIFAII